MNKTPPAGNILRKQVSLLPKYRLKLIPLDNKTVKVQLSLINTEQLAENVELLTAGANHKSYIVVGDTENYLIHFSAFRDSDLISVYDGCITFEITRLHNHEHKIMVHCISSNFVGLDQQCEHVFQNLLPSENKTVKMSNRKVERIEASEESLVAKSNKRRYTNDMGQCKEKKKREKNLIETFNNLKQSFYKSTKDIKSELDNTKELSHSILHDLLEPGQEINGDKKCETVSHNSVQNHFDIKEEVINASDDIGDDKITSILKDIENEMSTFDNDTVKTKEDENIYHNKDPNNKEKETTNIGWSRSKHSTKKYNKKYLHDKNNFSFLDTLEKEENVGKEFKETPANVGLSNEIKEQIKKFLEKSHDNSENTKLINFTSIYDMTDKLPNIESEECNITDRKYRNNESEQVLSEVYSNKASSVENIQQHLETSKTKDAEHLKKVSKVIEKNSTIKPNYLETSNKLKFDKINSYNDNIVNKTSDSNNCKAEHEAPLPSTIEKYNDLSKSNKIDLCNEYIHPKTETLDVDTFNLGPVVPISPTIDKSNSLVVSNNKQMLHNKSDLDLLNFNNKYLNNSVNNNSPDNVRSDQHESYKSILCSFPSNAAGILSNTNTSQNDSTSQSHNTSTKDYEFLSNFTYSASKFNIITKNDDKNRRIQIVNKLKIDLNITEFIYKGINSEHTPTEENINRKIEIEERTPHNITLDETIAYNVLNNNGKDRIMIKENDADRNIENNISNCAKDNTQFSENNGISDKSTIKSIIEKYKMKTKERNDAQQKLIKPVCNNKFTPIVKSNRQYRIRDLHKAENTRPANLLLSNLDVSGEDKGLCSIASTLTDKNNFMSQAPENDIVSENINDVANLNHFKYSAVDEDSLSTCTPIETEDIRTVLTESETNEINVSMFNPKTMLQRLGEDVLPFEEVIPPPLDFCDSDPYSPIQSDDRSMPGNRYTPLSSPSTEIEHFGSTLPNSDQLETWTLSHESDDDSDLFNKFQPHPVFTSQNKGPKFASREIKLSQFRFEGRPKFKK